MPRRRRAARAARAARARALAARAARRLPRGDASDYDVGERARARCSTTWPSSTSPSASSRSRRSCCARARAARSARASARSCGRVAADGAVLVSRSRRSPRSHSLRDRGAEPVLRRAASSSPRSCSGSSAGSAPPRALAAAAVVVAALLPGFVPFDALHRRAAVSDTFASCCLVGGARVGDPARPVGWRRSRSALAAGALLLFAAAPATRWCCPALVARVLLLVVVAAGGGTDPQASVGALFQGITTDRDWIDRDGRRAARRRRASGRGGATGSRSGRTSSSTAASAPVYYLTATRSRPGCRQRVGDARPAPTARLGIDAAEYAARRRVVRSSAPRWRRDETKGMRARARRPARAPRLREPTGLYDDGWSAPTASPTGATTATAARSAVRAARQRPEPRSAGRRSGSTRHLRLAAAWRTDGRVRPGPWPRRALRVPLRRRGRREPATSSFAVDPSGVRAGRGRHAARLGVRRERASRYTRVRIVFDVSPLVARADRRQQLHPRLARRARGGGGARGHEVVAFAPTSPRGAA